MLVPEAERSAVVAAVERQIVEQYGSSPSSLTVVSPPVQRDGYVEQTHTTYETIRAVEARASKPAPGARQAHRRA
jgi:hypothetical protein